ncbi:MAG TPA: radical SAM protein [Vicinamibacteria bacterium]|nr:radical SAM protein [Vicinamibacteria bacterium]
MNVLCLSMPDWFEHMAPVAIRMPNGALGSLAGNVDGAHRVAVADLILAHRSVRRTVERLVRELQPDVVALSVMTFQRHTALALSRLVRALRPGVRVVAGGYDPSLDPDAYADPEGGADFLVRGEGEHIFSELLRALATGGGFQGIAGLSWREGERLHHNPGRPVLKPENGDIRLPDRGARVLKGYALLGRPVDVVETSRGCTFDCSFCSIVEMRGRNFHRFPLERVMDDIRDATRRGARAIFIVDDNVMLDVPRFEALCDAIVRAGLHRNHYLVQAMTSSIADHGERLAPLMKRAGFRYVFLGIENVLEEDLGFLKARAKNLRHEGGRAVGNATLAAIEHLHRQGIFVVGGLIVGSPGDTAESVAANLDFARRYVDWPYIQHPTPYPRTPMTRDLVRRGLVLHQRLEEYDGTTAVVRSEHLEAAEIEFLRWKAERWMKLRHFPQAFRHNPAFCIVRGPAMIAHTLRGSWRALLGLESQRQAFERYRAIRRAERVHL